MNERERDWLLHEKYNGIETRAFKRDAAQLSAGEPLAYLIGTIPFGRLTISLSSRPFIPRPETEWWVQQACTALGRRAAPARVLDLCAGSGCIGISVLHALPEATVDFVEKNRAHHATIRDNIACNGIHPARALVKGGSLFQYCRGVYDAILANPPYLEPRNDCTQHSVRAFEPHEALFAGKKGMECIARIIAGLPCRLAKGGVAYIEHEPHQAADIRARAKRARLQATPYPDQYGVLRYSVFTHLSAGTEGVEHV